MRIGMISYDMQDFGGLEEYAVGLAVGLKQQGQDVCYLSAAWVDPKNQYFRRLESSNIPIFQPPSWISRPASDWDCKENILRNVMWCFSPITFLMGLGLSILKKQSFQQSWTSAHNWLKGQLMERIIGRDYRQHIGRLLLSYWKFRWHPDILHIQGYSTSLLFGIDWACANRVPVVYEEHQTPDPQFNWWKGFEYTINRADRVIAVSEKSAQGLREVCKVTRPIVVRGPLLPDPFNSGLKKEYYPNGNRPVTITTVARLYVTKGLTYLLDAAAIVKKSHPATEFKVYGDGELREELISKAERLGLDGNNIFVGVFTDREELSCIMSRTDIFLLSSVLEGQPLALVEAMAYGCPIVSTNVGGIPELVTDGVNGLLCAPADPHCLAEKIMILIEEPTLCEQLGRAARSFYENSPFEAKAVADSFVSTYGEVLEEHGKPVK